MHRERQFEEAAFRMEHHLRRLALLGPEITSSLLTHEATEMTIINAKPLSTFKWNIKNKLVCYGHHKIFFDIQGPGDGDGARSRSAPEPCFTWSRSSKFPHAPGLLLFF